MKTLSKCVLSFVAGLWVAGWVSEHRQGHRDTELAGELNDLAFSERLVDITDQITPRRWPPNDHGGQFWTTNGSWPEQAPTGPQIA